MGGDSMAWAAWGRDSAQKKQLKAAFWKMFHRSGEWFFPYNEDNEAEEPGYPERVSVYMGNWGGSVSVGESVYSTSEKHEGNMTRAEMVALLSQRTAAELAEMIVDLTDNADE